LKIRKLRLRNWCQYRDATFEFDSGLTAVRGPNGVGKSNLVTGIVFGITGDFSRNPGVKNDNICQHRQPKEPSFVELEFEHAGAEATIMRSLPSGQELRIVGDPTVYTRDKEVTEQLRKLLGVGERLLLDYVFVEQWKMFDFISKKPADRAMAFSQLFQTDRAERIWKALGEYTVPIPKISIDVDAVRLRLQQHQLRLAEVRNELASYADIPDDWNYRNDPNTRIIEAWAKRQNLTIKAEKHRRMVEAMLKQAEPVETKLAEAKKNEETILSVIDDARVAADRARDALTAWKVFEANDAQRQRLTLLLNNLEDHNRKVEFPVPPANYVDLSEQQKLQSELTKLESRRTTLEVFLGQFADGKTPECPVCGTPASQLVDRVEAYANELADLQKRYEAIRILLNESIDYNNRYTKYLEWQERYAEQKKSIVEQLAALGEVSPPGSSKEELHKAIDDYEIFRDALHLIQESIGSLEVSKSRLAGAIEAENRSYNEATAELLQINVTENDARAAQTAIDNRLSRYRRKGHLQAEANMLNQQIASETQMLTQAAAEQSKVRRAEQLQVHLNEVRAVFHRDNLPRKVAQAYLDKMRGEINEVLGVFNSPFRVEDVADLRFVIRKNDGTMQPAERLSGGEKVAFAVAFRIVVNSLFARELGLLCLDEPTAGLDEDNLSCMEAALGRLRELSRARNLQVILITHERGMDSLFDRVIQLPLSPQ